MDPNGYVDEEADLPTAPTQPVVSPAVVISTGEPLVPGEGRDNHPYWPGRLVRIETGT